MNIDLVKKPGTMRVVHTSDWHLGQELHGFDRGVEHDAFLEWLAALLVTLKADALIVTGDVYDTVNPPVPAQRRLYQFVRRTLAESTHLQIVVIGGNHDSAARLELPAHLLDADRIHFVGGMPRQAGRLSIARTLIELRDQTGAASLICAAVPYLRPGELPTVSEGESPVATLYAEAVEAAGAFRTDLPLIVTGHFHVCGGAVSELSERRIIIGGEEAVPSDAFTAGVAYAALGHLHKPQQIPGETVIRYAGSPFPLSMAEKDYQHSVVVIDFDGTDGMRTSLVPTPRPVAFYRVPSVGSAPLEAVEAALRSMSIQDPGEDHRPFLEVAVQLDGVEPELRQRIDAALRGKPLRLTRIVRHTEGGHTTLDDAVQAGASLEEMDPTQVFACRHCEEYGGEPPEDLRRAFDEVLHGILTMHDDLAGQA